MKTSKKIFVSLLGTIALVILAGFVAARIAGGRNGKDLIENKTIIPSFKVLLINNCDVHLSYGDSSFIDVSAPKGFSLASINYKLSNDTLKISDVRFKYESNVRIKIHSTDSLKNIIALNSDLSFDRYGTKNLALSADHSYISFNQDKKGEFSFHSLNIIGKKHSTINAEEFNSDNLVINLEKSEAELDITSLKINGNLADSSYISIKQSNEITLKKDATSKIRVDN